jgi:hypothetical protein
MTRTIQQYDVVALVEDIPAKNVYRGHVGTVIEQYAEDVFEVEFSDNTSGVTYAMIVLKASQLMKLYFEPRKTE